MSTFSIAGNENFTMVENAAGVLQNVQTSSEQSVESKIHNLTVYNENFANEVVGLGTIITVTGYAPTTLSTTGGGFGVFLNRVPKQGPATAETDDKLLKLPVGARVIGMRLTNNGTDFTGEQEGSFINMDCQEWQENTSQITGDRLAKGTPTGANSSMRRGLNSYAGVKFWPGTFRSTGTADLNTGAVEVQTDKMTLGTQGEDQGSGEETYNKNGSVLVEEGKQLVGVQMNGPNITGGDLAVKLWYIAP